jgi:hypothetical protein
VKQKTNCKFLYWCNVILYFKKLNKSCPFFRVFSLIIFVGKPEVKQSPEDKNVDEKITAKWILEKEVGRM